MIQKTDALTFWKRYEVQQRSELHSLESVHILDLPADFQSLLLKELDLKNIDPQTQNVEVSISPDGRYAFIATHNKQADFSERYIQFFRAAFGHDKFPSLDDKGKSKLQELGLTLHHRTILLIVDRSLNEFVNLLDKVSELVEVDIPVHQIVLGPGFRKRQISPRVLTEQSRKLFGKGSEKRSVYSYDFFTVDDVTRWFHECGHLFVDNKKGKQYRSDFKVAVKQDSELGSYLESPNQEMLQEVDAWSAGLWLMEECGDDLESFGDRREITRNILADVTSRIDKIRIK